MTRSSTFISGLCFSLFSMAQTSVTIEVQIGKADAGGTLRAALCPSSTAFDTEKGCAFLAKDASGKMETLTFENVASGPHAVKIFLDQDGDEKLGTNALGIPKEPFGFSNNAMGNFGPPSFEQAAFEVGKEPISIKIKLRG